MSKISLIGAGSTVFAKNLMGDILNYPELANSTITLFDIDEQRLGESAVVADRIKEEQLKVDQLLQEKGILKLNEKAYTMLSTGITSLEEVYALLTNI